MSDEAHPRDRLRRELSLQDAVFLVVASVVGSGIFLTPGAIAAHLPHAGLIVAAWVVGGLLSLAGALANAELGAMYPRAGGDYVYLREAFHPIAGFLVGWLTFFAIYAGTVATLAVGFAASLGAMFDWEHTTILAAAVATIVGCSALNWVGVRWGALVNNLTGWIKVAALTGFGLVAPFTGNGDWANLYPLVSGISDAAPLVAFALALSPVLFSYLGWNATIYVASEIRDPSRNVPRSLFYGLALCTGLYLLLNGVYLLALTPAQLAQAANAGEAAATVFFGEIGGRLLSGFVLVSILGTLSATILVGPRIAYAMALDDLFLPGGDHVSERFGTPTFAIAVQAIVAAGLVLLLESFPSALDYTTFAILLATIADVAALYRLRLTQPERARPYRAWGYPGIPALYVVANFAIAASLLWGATRESLVSLAVLAAGLPLYWLLARRRA
jgi:APA family basic amino acid/polyamine antiporter